MSAWVRRAGSGDAEWDVRIEPGQPTEPGWRHTGLLVTTLDDGASRTLPTGDREVVVVPLSGSFTVHVEGETEAIELAGRPHVLAGPTDVGYVPRDRTLTVVARGVGRVALACAPARHAFPVCRVPAGDVPVELRGAGACSRQVHNLGIPGVLEADSIIVCEVITPAGNWSSYPPHKHDEERPGRETALEEIYYVEVVAEPGAPPGAEPVGYLRNYGGGSGLVDPVDTLAEVRSGDVVLVPRGWHGPAMAPPGYHLYYLNVMAGPGPTRAWLIRDDPAHAWVRDGWAGQPVDPRLPFGTAPASQAAPAIP